MRKTILLALSLVLTSQLTKGQTTATDFTATDCSSASHNLFTELNSGKVVVLVWVMPCGTCVSDAKAGFDAAQSFASPNPGKVLYWLADDFGNTSCTALSNWASTNAIGPVSSTVAFFGNGGTSIDESDYGGTGMPHVVVMGGSDHHIYYNQKNGSNDGAAITSAITTAINVTAGVYTMNNSVAELALAPNPAKSSVSASYSLGQTSNVSIEIFDVIGHSVKKVALGEKLPGQHSFEVNFNDELADGIYILSLNAGGISQTKKFTVVK